MQAEPGALGAMSDTAHIDSRDDVDQAGRHAALGQHPTSLRQQEDTLLSQQLQDEVASLREVGGSQHACRERHFTSMFQAWVRLTGCIIRDC